MRTKTLPRKTKTLRVAIYLRVSTSKQLDGYGLDVQDERCRAWVDYQLKGTPHTIVDVYCDGGVSGKLAHREDLDRLTSDIEAGLIDVVVFAKLDRIGRTMKNIHRWVYDVTDFGVRVATADGRIDSEDQMFGIQLSLLAYMAEVEHALILERTMGGRIQKIAGGGWASGIPPYGYMLDEEGEPVVNPDEQEVIFKAADLLIDENMTRGEVAAELNEAGYRTRTGKLWEGNNLILRLRLTVRGYVDFTFSGMNEDGDEITTSYRVELPALFEDESRRQELEDTLEGLKGKPRTSYSNHLLSGHLFSLCGSSRYGVARTHQNDFIYRCSSNATVAEGHTCKQIDGEETEKIVWDEVNKLLTDPDAIKGLIDEWLGSVPDRADSYRARMKEIDEKLHRLRNTRRKKIAALVASLDDDDDDDQKLLEELKEEIAKKEKELREEQERIAEWLEEAEHKEERADDLRSIIDRISANVESLTKADKKGVLELLRIRVDIVGDSVSGQKGGSKDQMLEWHRESEIAIPLGVSDKQWARIESILAGKRKPQQDDRPCFEMLLEKLREKKGWHDYDHDERMGGKSWGVFYRLARRWFTEGLYAAALEAMGPYEGVPAPDGYTLPPMKIYGAFDDQAEDVLQNEDEAVKAEAGGATTSTRGITAGADGAERAAA
ncbi:recombinase family protein [Streptomyces sp. RK76]|uniref:recombinase family protein n=1 Tax=Streptomyces sp. RK76 TaxID=2824896 RepID=UPI001B368804|nr:recombinase family protein [Streptomyces sp. RK76]MBQ0949201.1 recombinase family protein [Streptomyces sp. RK76]